MGGWIHPPVHDAAEPRGGSGYAHRSCTSLCGCGKSTTHHTIDDTIERHTLSLLESPRIEERWKVFADTLRCRHGLFVNDRLRIVETTLTNGGGSILTCLRRWIYGNPQVHFILYRQGVGAGDVLYISDSHGCIPSWIIGITQLFYWTDGHSGDGGGYCRRSIKKKTSTNKVSSIPCSQCNVRIPAFGNTLLQWRFSADQWFCYGSLDQHNNGY